MVQTHTLAKYGVNHFTLLSELNDELKGRFETITPTPIDDVQLGHEQLAQPCIRTINNPSINNSACIHTVTQGIADGHLSMQKPNTISELMAKIINPDIGNLFFINYTANGLTRKEWRLIKVELNESLKLNPKSLANARLLVTFLIPHPDDAAYSAPNQRFWTQYHTDDGRYNFSNKYHLICPTNNEEIYCRKHQLQPFRD